MKYKQSSKNRYLNLIRRLRTSEIELSLSQPSPYMTRYHLLIHRIVLRERGAL